MWPFKKKSADHALKELVERLSQALGSKLLGVLLYGSKASGEFQEDRSDVNVFILLENLSKETFESISRPLRAWVKAGHLMPVFIQKSELQSYANSLPIEFLDMQDHHQLVFGSNPLQELKVARTNLRAQCVQELSVKLLKLRQAVLLIGGRPKHLRTVLMESIPSVLTLYRAALRLETDVLKGPKILAAKELIKRAGGDGDCLERLHRSHIRRQTDNLEDLTRRYLEGLERALVYLNRQ